MENYFSNKNLMDMVIKWKTHLLIIALLAGVISIVFSSSFFIKPKFKSFAIVYPVNLGEYSEESETEQMLELLNSGEVRDSVIKKFNLDEHYKIDRNYKYYHTAINGKYSDDISFRKTENEAVKIEVLDTDPELAAKIVNGIIDTYDNKVREMHSLKYKEELDIRVRELARQKVYIDSLVTKLTKLGEDYGLIDVRAQAEGLFTGPVSGTRSLAPNGEKIESFTKNMAVHGQEFQKLSTILGSLLTLYNETYSKYNDAYRELNKKITYSSVVTPPFVADKKSWPKRSVIVFMSVVLTLILALIIIGVIENRSYTKPE
ncbi:MAG: hypothetical protein J7L96_00230 [Bacteroidales bacterium]|nr:hypothetical protein [Bacteroidales bacterium]